MMNVSWMSADYPIDNYDGPPRNVAYVEQLDFDSDLRPVNYEIVGTAPSSQILILDVEILEATGREPYRGDVLIVGKLQPYRLTRDTLLYSGRRLTNMSYRSKICPYWQSSQQRSPTGRVQCACFPGKRPYVDAGLGRLPHPLHLEWR